MAQYAQRDVEASRKFHEDFQAKFICVGGLYYNRQQWEHYRLEKRRWAREDPSVVVPMPVGFR